MSDPINDRGPICTPNSAVARLKRELGEGNAPIGPKRVREWLSDGTLAGARVGNRDLFFWQDLLDVIDRLAAARKPVPVAPDREERMARRVQERLRHERERE